MGPDDEGLVLSHNPLFVGASIRTREREDSEMKGEKVTIPFSSGPLFGPPFSRFCSHTSSRHNPLFVGASIRTGLIVALGILATMSQSPFRRGLYSDRRQPRTFQGGNPGHNPLFVGASIRTAWIVAAIGAPLVVTIPFSSGPLFGHTALALLSTRGIQSQSPFRRGLYSDSRFPPQDGRDSVPSQSPFRRGLYSDQAMCNEYMARTPGHNPLVVGASIRTCQ